ncbi:MAG: hypothetical protein ACJAXN_001689 [Psychromonas sp.]|jgi:hypothetical protein
MLIVIGREQVDQGSMARGNIDQLAGNCWKLTDINNQYYYSLKARVSLDLNKLMHFYDEVRVVHFL